jgi:hypothetical protein
MAAFDSFTTQQASLRPWTEADLLGPEPLLDEDAHFISVHDHAVVTAPALTGDVLGSLGADVFPQKALYGRILAQSGADLPKRANDSRLFINTNAPFSALVCGVQVSTLSYPNSQKDNLCLVPRAQGRAIPRPFSSKVF